ncbi:MAG: NAD-dependent epimerase/dehydratase family protein [bacterium]|nr:NAD-dependent epimerase/dehydratase family protein [bacterium]
MHILLTGATGFVGRHLLPMLLGRGHQVTAIVRDEAKARNLPLAAAVNWIQGDLHQDIPNLVQKIPSVDLTIHLAWPGLPNFQANYHLDETLPAEIDFLTQLLGSGMNRLLVTGTCFEYGLAEGSQEETSGVNPVTKYAKAKNKLRLALEKSAAQYNANLQWARLFYMFGPGQHSGSLFSLLDQAIANGDADFKMSPGDQIRDFQPVFKTVVNLCTIAESPGFSGIVNICSGQPVSILSLVENHLEKRSSEMKLLTGHYPCPEYEPKAFWGNREVLTQLENALDNQPQNQNQPKMKAEIKPRINQEGRTRLEKVIPLATPMVLFVDPSSSCNFKCQFCPTGDPDLIKKTGRWQGQLPWDLYLKIIEDLKAFPDPLKVLRLYKDGEPLLNKNFAQMVQLAKDSGVAETVDTTTNGFLLTPEVIGPALQAGLDRINISVDGLSDEQFQEFTGRSVNFERYVKNIQLLYEAKGNCEICIKIAGDHLKEDDKKFFYDTFGNYADRIFIENMAPCWPEFDVEERCNISINQGIYDQPIGEVNTCPYIFYSLAINADGITSLCFLDWARKLVLGDIRNESLLSIWNGDKLHNHRVAHLEGRRKEDEFCAECGQLSHCSPDNIDPFASRVLSNLLDARKNNS